MLSLSISFIIIFIMIERTNFFTVKAVHCWKSSVNSININLK